MIRNRMNVSDTALEIPKSILFKFNITSVIHLSYLIDIMNLTYEKLSFSKLNITKVYIVILLRKPK